VKATSDSDVTGCLVLELTGCAFFLFVSSHLLSYQHAVSNQESWFWSCDSECAIYNGIGELLISCWMWLPAPRRELCRSVVPFLSSLSFLFHHLVVYSSSLLPIGLSASTVVPCISRYTTPLSFVNVSTSNLTRGGLIPSCLPLIPCHAVVGSLFTKRESIIGVRGLTAQASLISSACREQAMGLLPLLDSCFALSNLYPTFHILSLSLLRYVYTIVSVSRYRLLPFSRTGVVGRSDVTWHEG
jgi:hypothetical protein